MALATVRRNCVSTPRRGSSEGASLTASVTALLRVHVPGGAEVRGFGVRERLITHMVHARQGPGITRPVPVTRRSGISGVGLSNTPVQHTYAKVLTQVGVVY